MIHQYKLNGYNIVLDINSGAIHVVDDLSYDVISRYEKQDPETITADMLTQYGDAENLGEPEIREVMEDIRSLKEQGKLFTLDPYEEKASFLKNKNRDIKALCLHVAHTCNLNCEYCFAGQGRFRGKRDIMSEEVGRRALDFLVEHSGNRKNLEVDFFGGEPLMNWDVVKAVTAYGRELEKTVDKHFRFTLTTNGMGINDEVIEFSNREMHNVVLSLDGRREIHDALRKTIDGQGSYDTIVPKFQEMVKRRGGKDYYIRGTFTHNNAEFFKDILHMLELGFRELSMEPVVCSQGDPYALTEEDMPTLLREYELLADEMIRRRKEGDPFHFYHYNVNLAGGPCIYKRISGCGSGSEYFAVTPWGDLYPCHQFVGEPEFCMGDIWKGVTNAELMEQFRGCNAYSREECRECWAKLYCSGGCAANAWHVGGALDQVYEYGCRLFRKRMECAIMVQVAEAMEKKQEQEDAR